MPLSVGLSHRASTARRVLGALADFSRRMGMPSILQDGTAPAGQVARLLVFSQFQGLLESFLEVGLNGFAFDPSTQKSPHRNPLNGVVPLATPPARRSSPANERNGSSISPATVFGKSL